MLIQNLELTLILLGYMEELMKNYIIGITAGLALVFAGFAMASGDTFVPPKPVVKGGFVIGADGGYGELNTPNVFTNYNEALLNDAFAGDPLISITNNSNTQDTGDFVWGVHIGYDHQLADTGWLSNALLGVEVGYKDLGNSTYKTKFGFTEVELDGQAINTADYYAKSEYKSQAVDFLLKADYYIVKGWHVFAKGGFAELYTKYQFTSDVNVNGVDQNNIGTQSAHYWNMRPEYVLGTGYTFGAFGAKKNMHLDIHAYYDHIASEPFLLSTTDRVLQDPNIVSPMNNIVAVPGVNMVMGGLDFSFNPFV